MVVHIKVNVHVSKKTAENNDINIKYPYNYSCSSALYLHIFLLLSDTLLFGFIHNPLLPSTQIELHVWWSFFQACRVHLIPANELDFMTRDDWCASLL